MRTTFMEGLWVAAQPVVDLSTGHVVGYESLIRGNLSSGAMSPAQLFEEARREEQEAALEGQCRALGIAWGHRHLAPDQLLFLNIHDDYATLPITSAPATLEPNRVALELSEHRNILENPACLQQIQRWRKEGYHLVLDDYGVGYAGLGLLLAVQPDMAKMDRLLIAGIDHDPVRQAILTHVVSLAEDQGVTLVAEGIETLAELRTLQAIGIPLGQGFFLGRPQADPVISPRPHVVATPPLAPVRGWAFASDPDLRQQTPSDQEIFRKTAEIVYATPFPAYVVTRTRRIVAWNGAATDLTGWTQQQMEQHRCRDQRLNHHDLDGRPLCVGACPLVSTMVHNHVHKQHVTATHADGSRLPIEVVTTPLWNPVTQKTIGAIEYFWAVSDSCGPDPDPSRTHKIEFPKVLKPA